MIRKALDACTGSRLYTAINLSVACSLRVGEALGLTWDNVHISDEDIACDDAYILVEKELECVSKKHSRTTQKQGYNVCIPAALRQYQHTNHS
jgi:hypothetical protein